PRRDDIVLRPERARRILGIDLSREQMAGLLGRLQLEVQLQGDAFRVTPPSYRFDLTIEEDLVEEVARIHGYEHIEAALPPTPNPMLPSPEQARGMDALRSILIARDYQEMIGYSFVDAEWERDLAGNDAPVALANPIASQMSVMRSSLFGNLLDALR